MRTTGQPSPQASTRSPKSFLKREDGTTAIEFAIVAIPFFMFIFGLMGVSSYFFIMTSLEKGMDQASRMIRTGQAQTPTKRDGEDKPARGMTVEEFKQDLCGKAGTWVKCSDIQVFVQKFASWDEVDPQPCITNSKASVNTAKSNDPIADYSGEANAIVLVTTCYKWRFAGKVPYLNLGQMTDGSMMMQAATAFRTEPYSSN